MSQLSPSLSALIAHARAELRWHRRSVTTALIVVAALVAINSAHANGRRESVLVATHDLNAGAALHASDLRTESRTATEIPDGALRAPPGDTRTVALPIRRGEIITDVRLLGTGLLDAAESAIVARRLGRPELAGGAGLRTMATSAAGFNPLSYHCLLYTSPSPRD